MATVLTSATDIAASHYSSEEALLDAYDLQWKAIDIRLEKLRNECERMILEYEVEVKQQMYMRECEDLVRQKQAQHDAQQAELGQELADKEHRVEKAEEELKRRSTEAAQRAQEEKETKDKETAQAEKKNKKPTGKRKREKVVEEQEEEQVVVAPKPKAIKKAEPKKKTTVAEKPEPRPVSPPVYSPDENATEAAATEEEPQVQVQEEEPAADLSHVADNDLLEMLSQDQGYESEDFGDTSIMSLIHPQSPAMLSPKRLKKKAAFEAAALAKNAASPLRSGAASLADRIMNRIKTVAKQPLGGPEILSDASNTPPPMLATPAKRALKRRKTAVLSATEQTTAVNQVKIVNQQATQGITQEDGSHQLPQQVAEKAGTKVSKTKVSKKTRTGTDGEAESDASHSGQEPESEEAVQQKTTKTLSKKKPATKSAESQPRQGKKGPKTGESKSETAQALDDDDNHPENNAYQVTEKVTQIQERHVGAVTGRSRARQTAKQAALRAAAEEEDDVAGFPDIKTPKVPRKKMGVDGKRKQINDLAAKRAEFQMILSESAPAETEVEESEHSAPTRKRRRQDDAEKRKEPVELEFHTPKPKAKKSKVARNQFPHDELNIMKSPVPLLRAKIAEKKKKQEQEAKKKNKRTVSERDDIDDEDAGYGSPAVNVPTSTVLPSTPSSISVKPAISFPTAKKGPDDIAAAASDYASRWINSGLVTRAKKNAVKAARKPATKSPKPASLWGGGASFFDAFVNTAAPVIPRLKSTSSVPKE